MSASVPNPRYLEQQASKQTYKGQRLYTYCEVRRILFSLSHEIIMDGKSDAEFVISRAGGHCLVKIRGIPACLMKRVTHLNSYKLTINTAIDLCLMICICTICDEMDEQNWGGHNIVTKKIGTMCKLGINGNIVWGLTLIWTHEVWFWSVQYVLWYWYF